MEEGSTYSYLIRMVTEGHTIRWVGQAGTGSIRVQVYTSEKTAVIQVPVDNIIDTWPSNGVLRNGGSMHPMTDVSFVPPHADDLITYRNATVLGINISGSCAPGSGNIYRNIDGCTCGYDIELDLRDETRGGFPLPSVPILSVALWCTCGFSSFISTLDPVNDKSHQVLGQSELVSKFIEEVLMHQPLWLVGWNCYSFDNTCLLYNSIDSKYEKYFRKIKIGTSGVVDYGYILDLEGTYNVDPLGYMQRSPSHSQLYNQDFSLYGVGLKLGTAIKTDMPDLYADLKPHEIYEYNMNDSMIAAQIWIKSNLIYEVPSLAVATCSPIYDCIRYMTSVTSRCAITSEALAINMKIDWSPCETIESYTGGKVLDPIKGRHSDVTICDFSSMYPTIMINANISPESLTVMKRTEGGSISSVRFDENYVYVDVQDVVARFSRHEDSLVRKLLLKLVTLRRKHRNTNKAYATSLKIAANSLYGAMGYQNSPLYNPLCSTSTTAIGRWCLDLACQTFESHDMKVVYGDTDSCMIVPRNASSDSSRSVKTALASLHLQLSSTPLFDMKMEIENELKRIFIIEKKKYCFLLSNGEIKYKGMSIVRRDALGVCKDSCKFITDTILKVDNADDAGARIASYIDSVITRCINMQLTPREISKVMKRNQRRSYVYKDKLGKERAIPIDMSSIVVDNYDITYVMNSFKHEVNRLTSACRLGSIADVLRNYSTL